MENNFVVASSKCTGCGVCRDSCPVSAIQFVEGDDLASYPNVDESICIKCGKCKFICPIEYEFAVKCDEKQTAYVAYLLNQELRNKCASGGMFESIVETVHTMFANVMIAGAVWDGVKVKHKLLPYEDRAAFRKSKYVQSDCSGIYKEVRDNLNNNVFVIFSGTPCQIIGLKRFLGKEYTNLLLVDIVCHGVPGENVFRKYLKSITKKHKSEISECGFREKKKDISGKIHSDFMKIYLVNGKKIYGNYQINNYLRSYRKGLICRESCYSCKYATIKRYSDITIGDYWNIQKLYPQLSDSEGVSCLLGNTKKGKEIIDRMKDVFIQETPLDFLISNNTNLRMSSIPHKKRDTFFEKINDENYIELVNELIGKPKRLRYFCSMYLPDSVYKLLKKIKK